MSFLLTAWIISLVASLGAIFIGEVLGQTPCVLCWYQRAFMFPLAVILGIACYRSDFGVWRYALPLAMIGGLIAAYHSALYANLIPAPLEPCGEGPSCTDADMTILAFQSAATAGLDIEKARKFMTLPDITSILLRDKADVKAVGVKGTPTFFVNGKPLPQFGREELREFVDAEVAAARANVRR